MEIQVVKRQGYLGNLLETSSDWLKNSAEILIFIFVVVFKLMYFNLTIGAIYERVIDFVYVVLVSIGTALVLSSWTLLLSRRMRVFSLITIDVVVSFIILSDLNFFRYFGNFISVSVLTYAFQLGTVKKSASTLINIKDIVYILDIVISTITLLVMVVITRFKFTEHQQLRKQKMIKFISMLIAGVLIIGLRPLTVSGNDKYGWTFESFQFVANMNVLSFHGYDAYKYSFNKYKNHKPLTEEEKADIKAWFEEHNKENTVENKYTGIEKGKNLIVVQVEALQQFVIDKKVNGKEITPNLNKLIKRSMYFDNYYYQTGQGNTSDAEFLSNISLMPVKEGAVYFKYPSNKYNTIANKLKKEGYSTAAFHGYKGSFWNRGTMYPNMGIDNFYSMEKLDDNEKVGFGISDKSFLNQSAEKIKLMQQPYYAFLVTLSSHHPYEYLRDYKGIDVGKYEDSFIGDYFKSIHYADEALGDFVSKLESEGVLDNSVLVLYGDHFAIDSGHADELGKFLGKNVTSELEWSKQQKVPLVIHLPKDEQKSRVSTLGGQLDLFPTLANLFGLSKDNLLGNDLLGNSKNIVIFRNKSFTDGNIYVSGLTNTVYNLKNGKTQKTEKYSEIIEKARRKLNVSDLVIEKNLIPFLEGKDK